MSRLSFQEKMLWAQLLAILVAGVFYVHYLMHAAPGRHYFHVVVILLLLLFVSVRTFFRRRSKNVVEDERDRSIACVGARWSNVILWVGLLFIMALYWDHGMHSAAMLIGLIFHLLLLAGVGRIVRELVAYRMAA